MSRLRVSAVPLISRLCAGSPGASGCYPLAIVSDEEEAGGAGRPSRAHSLRNALQSWRSIRTALGDRHSSEKPSAFAAAAGVSVDGDDDPAPHQVCTCTLYPSILRSTLTRSSDASNNQGRASARRGSVFVSLPNGNDELGNFSSYRV